MKGILFSAEMAQAIYEGRKTQTRRVIEPQPNSDIVGFVSLGNEWLPQIIIADTGEIETRGEVQKRIKCPYSIGERLYVQEPFTESGDWRDWQAAKAMTQDQTRSIIEITAIRVERIQDITEEDAKAEGVLQMCANEMHTIPTCIMARLKNWETPCYTLGFVEIWQNLYHNDPVKGWSANPWVWVYEFKRAENIE